MSAPDHQFSAEPSEGDLIGAGLRIHYLDWGPTPGPTIVFLHGGGLNAHTWDVVCDVLHEDFRCLALDLRGHGDSDWHPDGDYSLGSYVADLAAAVDALGLNHFLLVGMSLGGVVALAYAAAHSARLTALVLVDTGPGGSRPAGRRRLGEFMTGPEEFASIEEIIDRAIAFNPRRSRERLQRSLRNNLRQTERGTWAWKYDPRFRGLGKDAVVSEASIDERIAERSLVLWEAAKAVTVPTLIVRGGQSDMFHDEDAERGAAGFPNGRWIRIDGASHTVQSDHPYELAAAIRDMAASGPRA